jgi:hypothetical protein
VAGKRISFEEDYEISWSGINLAGCGTTSEKIIINIVKA